MAAIDALFRVFDKKALAITRGNAIFQPSITHEEFLVWARLQILFIATIVTSTLLP
jgi:hypothetical protein